MSYPLAAINLLIAAADRADLARREVALYDARAALADKDGFAQYVNQFKAKPRG